MDAILVLKASVLLMTALGGAALLRHASATVRHQLWTVLFAALLGLPLVTTVVPQLPVPVPAAWRVAPPEVGAGVPTLAADAALPAPGDLELSTILGALWMTGSLIAVAMILLSLWRVHRLRLTATELRDPVWHTAVTGIAATLHLTNRPQLLLSPTVRTPMAGGVRRPVVFLPENAPAWSPEHRDIVLAHELAHIARRDPLRHVLLRLAVALYWFHPLAWLAGRLARAAQEQACDEVVLSLGTRASVYARVLMEMAGSPAPAHVAALPMSERPFLETRIMAILNPVSVSPRRRTPALASLGIALLTLSVAAAQPRVAAQIQTPAVAPMPPQKPATPSLQPKDELRELVESSRLVEAEFRAHVEAMKASEADLREQMRQAEQSYKAQIAAFDTHTARLRAELEVIRSQEERSRLEIAETMKMIERLARSAEINLTDQQRRRARELNQDLANKLVEIEKSLQRQP